MKKGFTLIEMLGIITVLAILLLVTFPNLSKSLKITKQNENNNFTNNLKVSAEAYVELNRDKYGNLDLPGGSISFTIQDLYDANLLKGQYEELNMNDAIVVVTDQDKTLKYFYKDQEIGVLNQINIDDKIVLEISLIKNSLNQGTIDGIYYYNNSGNLENGENIININNILNNIKGNVLIHNHQLISGCVQYNNKNYDYYKGTITQQQHPCSTTRGENLVINGDLSYHDTTNFSGSLTYNNEGYISRTSSSGSTINTKNYIPVNIEKTYEFGLTARSNNQDSTKYSGFLSYDIDRNSISPSYVMYISNTLTTLAQDLNNGDEYIYLTDMTNWNKTTSKTYQQGFIFWNYVDSTGYQYPELTYSRNAWGNLYTNDNIDLENNRIKLTSPWNNGTILAGTKLSQSNDGSTYNYNLKGNTTMPSNFTEYSSIVSGISPNTSTKFRYGTKYIRWFMWDNHNVQPNVTTDFKDIYIREVIE